MNEQQLRSVIRQILSETSARSDIVLEYGGMTTSEYRGLLKHLTEPFKDVARAAALTGQDVLNALSLTFDTLTTLSPAKLKKAREDYRKRNDKLLSRWQPIMAASDAAIANSDLGIVLFAMDPAMFLGAKLGQAGLEAITNVPEYLEQAGWEIPLLKTMGITSTSSGRTGSSGKSANSDKNVNKTVDLHKRLRKVFYGSGDDYGYSTQEVIRRSSRLLSEKDENKKPLDIDQLRLYLNSAGISSEAEEVYEQLYDSRKEQINQILQGAKDQIDVLKKFGEAKSFKELDDNISAAENKVDSDALSAVKNKIMKLKSDLQEKSKAAKASLKAKLEAEIKAADPNKKMSKEEIERQAEERANKDLNTESNEAANEVLSKLREETQPLINDALTKMRSQVEEELTADWPEDKASARSMLSKTPNGKKYLKLIDDALNSILKLKETP
jgi:hypothetical protein